MDVIYIWFKFGKCGLSRNISVKRIYVKRIRISLIRGGEDGVVPMLHVGYKKWYCCPVKFMKVLCRMLLRHKRGCVNFRALHPL